MPGRDDEYILAVDLGTSGPKVGLFSTRGELVDHEFEPTRLNLLPDGGAEQCPDDWWNAIKAATRRLLGRGLVPAGAIVGINCTTIWSGTVAVDRDGRPLMDAIIWMDSRGADHVKRITGGIVRVEGYGLDKLFAWLRLTGGIPTHSGKDSIGHILYIQHERPEIYRSTHKFLEAMDYLNLRLTGKCAASYNSIALHWLTDNRDIQRVSYHKRLLALAGIDREKLPDLHPAAAVLGTLLPEAARELGLTEKVRVVMGSGDAQCSAVGSGAVKDFDAHLSIGTSSWLTCHVPFKKTDLQHNMASLPSALPGRYFIANEQECAGACLNFLRDNVLYPDDELSTGAAPPDVYPIIDRMAQRAPAGSGKVIFTPWLYGERTPVEDHRVRGGFFNVSLHATRGHLVRAVLEGVAYNSRWLLGHVERFAGRRFDAIQMIGGGARSDVWCQIHADVLDRTIRQVKDPILANLRGAAFLAAVSLGYMTVDEIPDRVPIACTYRPDPAHRKAYDELFAEFLGLYKSQRPVHARLNRAG